MSVPAIVQKFKLMIEDARESSRTTALSSPFFSRGSKHMPAAVQAGLDKVKAGLSFDLLDNDNFDIYNVQDVSGVTEGRPARFIPELTIDKADTQGSPMVIMNWLLDVSSTLIKKITQHAAMIKFTQKVVEKKADQEEVELLKAKIEMLEKECSEVRQRGMKGNLILSSPDSGPKPSLLFPQEVLDNVTNSKRLEKPQEMCVRAIKKKTGIEVPLEDIAACHSLNTRGSNTTYIVRITNRKPGSAWDILSAGMLTGKHKITKANFTKDNLYINFQTTKQKGELSKVVRDARKARKIVKYGMDQNARITVKVTAVSEWVEVTSEQQLSDLVANTPPAPASQNRPYNLRR